MIATGRIRLKLEAQARKALHFVDEFENSGRGWFWETDSLGTLSYVSQQLADDFQCDPEALLGRQFTDLLSVDHASESAEERKTLGFHLSARFPFSDVVVRPASEEDVHWSLSGNPIFDERGRFLGFRGIGTDLTEQRKSEREISRLARFDSLTGLPNRAMMRQTLEEALRNSAHRQKGCALFMIDLDRFKNVNDTLGHPIGDALLRQVAERLKSVMGNHGQVGRLGGDEFQAVLPGTVDIGFLEPLARTLIEQASRPYVIEGHRVTIGASVGIAIGDPGRASADALVRNADLALYAAKAAGRGKHWFYEPSMHSEAAERQLLENDLRQAIERGELAVALPADRPCRRRRNIRVRGAGPLATSDPRRRPALQIHPACRGSWTDRQDRRVGASDRPRGSDTLARHVRVAVNLSPLQFNDPDVVPMIAKHLRETGVRPERLELEITEGVFLAEGDSTDETFAKLKKLGVRLSLDDFGTGYSSLGYLKKAPFDKIKIDQSFVRGAASGNQPQRGNHPRNRHARGDTRDGHLRRRRRDTRRPPADPRARRQHGPRLHLREARANPRLRASSPTMSRSKLTASQCSREPRHRLMRRAVTCIGGVMVEVKLRNISSMGALVECHIPVAPGTNLAIDIVGVGPVRGVVRWAQSGKFGVQFDNQFDLGRLAPKKEKRNDVQMLTPFLPSAGARG